MKYWLLVFLVVCACSVNRVVRVWGVYDCGRGVVWTSVWTCRGRGDGGGVHERKTTDPRLASTTSPSLLGWSSVSEKSAEVVAPEKKRAPCACLVKAGLVPRPDTLMEAPYAE